MSTWIVGDIHGCADELATLLERLALGPDDTFVSVGDLFHRGPDPVGVARLLEASRARFILGNHELRVLARLGRAPSAICSEPMPRAQVAPLERELDARDLDGDGAQPCTVAPHERAGIVEFLQTHSGFCLRRESIPQAGLTRDGREWLCVHAGLLPDLEPEESSIAVLTRLRRLDAPGAPWWYEHYEGPDLVLFGHTPSRIPRMRRSRGQLVALGLDTGCVYGGTLTAYSPELDTFESVRAAEAYARA